MPKEKENGKECGPFGNLLNGATKLSKWCKITATMVASIIVIGGAFMSFNYHFATASEMKEFKVQTIQTFQDLRKEWKQDRQKDRLQVEYDFALRRMYDLKDQLRKNPNDQELKQDYEDAKQVVKDLKERLSGD